MPQPNPLQAPAACTALSPDPRSVGRARRFVSDALAGMRCQVDEDLAILLVSEIVTNVVRHAGGPGCELSIRRSGSAMRFEVHDHAAALPRRREPPLDATGGRGLFLVDALATAWGARPGPADGKTVWFEIPAAPA